MLSNPWMLVKGGKQVKFRPPFGTMAEMIEHWAKKQPEKTAIEFVEVDKWDKSYKDYKKYNWRELREKVFETALMLKRRGLKQGDTIAFAYHNHPNILILSLAAWTSGMKTVPLDLKRDDEEMMKYKLELSGAKMVFKEGEELDKNRDKRYKSYKNYNNNGRVSLNSEALVLFTSGTTARPKGTLLTQENLVANADGIADWLRITSDDRFMILLPLHHINSTTMCVATLLRGGTVILLSRYSNSRFWELAAATSSTLSSVVPTIIHDQLAQLTLQKKWRKSICLRRIQLGSAPVQPQEAERFVDLTSIPLIQGYGQTETALRSTGVAWDPEHPLDDAYWKGLRQNSIGTELKWTNVTVMTDNGSEAREGEEGEICVRGPVIMRKYLKNSQATREAFAHGWFHSGDLGYWKSRGQSRQYFLQGRIKEIIIKSGVNISPLTVEKKLKANIPNLDQVYVIGIPDSRVGEEVAAVAVWKQPGKPPASISHLSAFETPGYWYSLKAENLPMTSTGKVQRVKLKQMFQKCSPVAHTKTHMFRVISPLEQDALEEAWKIHNIRWSPMETSKQEWDLRLREGVLLAAQERASGAVQGSVFFIRQRSAIRLLAISTVGNPFHFRIPSVLPFVSAQEVEEYASQLIDPVLQFHYAPKGGLREGARIVKVVPRARPTDVAALGFGILMVYPNLKGQEEIYVNADATLGTQLVEAALRYAQQHGIEKVEALTRPAGLLTWAIQRRQQ